jgi:hypothetical protein
LWASNYTPLLEAERLEAIDLYEQHTQQFRMLHSEYRIRLERRNAVARRLSVPFSTMARSLSYFNQRVPTRVWKDNQRHLRIVLIGNGHFHSLSHLSFCLIEGWWECCCCTFAAWQGNTDHAWYPCN